MGLGQEQIARSCSIGQATVHRYLERAAGVGLGWVFPDDCDNQRLNELLFPMPPVWPPFSAPARSGLQRRSILSFRLTIFDVAVGLGGIPRSSSGRLQLWPVLRVMSTVESVLKSTG
jgi:hypothetical protein